MKCLVYGAGVIGGLPDPCFVPSREALRSAMPDWQTLHRLYDGKEQ